MRLLALIALIPLALSAQDAREIVRRAVQLDQRNAELERNYTHLERQEVRMLDGSGKVKSKESKTFDLTWLEGSPYRKLVARNDQPLSRTEQQKESDKENRELELRRKQTKEEREQRLIAWQQRQQKRREPFKELPDAFDFRISGEESMNGRPAYVIDATPKPGYKPKLASASYFPKIKGRLWIDKESYQPVRVDLETLDTISFAGFLVRLSKGTHLTVEMALVNNETWFPKRAVLHGSLRVLFVKGYRGDIDYTFSDYRKFSAESRVVQ